METKVLDNDVIFPEISKMISEGRSVELRVKGNSMNPFFVSGRDSICLSPVRVEDLKPGMFILGRDSRRVWLAHRIVSVESDHVILNGDGNALDCFEQMPFDGIVAQVSAYVRKGRRGTMDGSAWKAYSTFWRMAGWARIGKWSVRRLVLAAWRRLHPSNVLKTK